jgi:hypothetical protein
MSKLWKVAVTLETTAYAIVFADTEDDAEDLARDNKRDILDTGDEDFSACASEITSAEKLPWGWSEHDTPYGGDNTIAKLFEVAEDANCVQRDIYTIDMFAGAPA